MSGDKLVFDLSNEIEKNPNVFVRKDWVSLLDNKVGQYADSTSVLDTSQLSNSNKWQNLRESFLSIPLLLTLTGPQYVAPALGVNPTGMQPATQSINTGISGGGAGVYFMGTSCDYVMSLKNSFTNIIHSFTMDLNGVTVAQQMSFVSMINAFKLVTTLSWNDVLTQGATIGFWPDDYNSYTVNGIGVAAAASSGGQDGQGTCNNSLTPTTIAAPLLTSTFARYSSGAGNEGVLRRAQFINLDPDAPVGQKNIGNGAAPVKFMKYSDVMSVNNMKTLWLSYISTKTDGATPVLQISVCATVYLKNIHDFFEKAPLLKGTFLKMTMFLNNGSANFTVAGKVVDSTGATLVTAGAPPLVNGASVAGALSLNSVSVPVGGVLPLMITSAGLGTGGSEALGNGAYIASISVGSKCLNTTQKAIATTQDGTISQNIYMYTPMYSMAPVFESSYLSSPVKTISYSDYYQYQIINIQAGSTFNQLISNGIAGIKSVTVMPFYSQSAGAAASGLPAGIPVYQSPFDIAGCGATSPLCLFTAFNLQISGANAIYNSELRMFEHFNDQFYGCNSVNAGMTQGLTSGLIDQLAFQNSACFYYTNVSRMLPVEESVPKSIQLQGQSMSAFAVDLFVFVEYAVEISIDAFTGARV